MARLALTPQACADTGLEATYAAANADGYTVAGSGDIVLHLVNASVDTDVVVTLQTPATVAGLPVAETTVTVGFGEEWFLGPFPKAAYNRAAGSADEGSVYVDFDGVADLTIAALQV